MKYHALAIGGLLAVSSPVLHAGCCAPHDAEEIRDAAQAIGEYRITSRENVAGPAGQIFTRYTAQLNDSLKGKAPGQIEFRTPGGKLGNVVEFSSLGLDLTEGSDYILHLNRNAAGEFAPLAFRTHANPGTLAEKKAVRNYFRGGARGKMPVAKDTRPVSTDQGFSGIPQSVVTPTGYSHVEVDNIGYPTRFTPCDGGYPIPYLVDIDPAKLPPGMSPQDAVDAVAEALGKWSASSSLKFRYAGTQSFGGAPGITHRDGFIRIQLHDTYNFITEQNVIGVAGGRVTNDPGFRAGGSIAGQGFHERLSAYVVLEHDSSFLDNIANFKQVLTHELGHALGLGHSSNNTNEPDPILKNATMYWEASNDGRGAALTVYDEDRIGYGYPVTNGPPYVVDRFLNCVADGSSIAGNDLPVALGVNRIAIKGLNLQGQTFSAVSLVHSTDSANWNLSGNELAYTPAASISAPLLSDADIAAGTFHFSASVQVSDGTNLSRVARIGVIQITSDSKPKDGLPNTWMSNNFGNNNPAPEPLEGQPRDPRDPLSDPDGDGLNNRMEYNLGTNPKDPGSPATWLTYDPAQLKLTYTPRRYVACEIQETTDFSSWTTRGIHVTSSVPQPIIFDAEPPSIGSKTKFYRVMPMP